MNAKAPARALRRRRKRSLVGRIRVLWVFIVMVVVALAYATYAVITLPALRVHHVAITIDGLDVTEPQVRAAAAIDRGANLWLLDTTAIARRIEAIPYVDTAIVRRVPTANVQIAVSERAPAACVVAGARIVTVDETRRILQNGCAGDHVVRIALANAAFGLPGSVVATPALAGLIADSHTLRDAGLAVRSVERDRYGQLIAIQSDGVRLLFGSDADVAEKAKLVRPVLAAARPGHVVSAVDLRAPATPVVEFR